jgi:hypothetical protein
MRSMVEKIIGRVIRIIKLDQTVWPEIEHDEEANTEAAVVVVVAALLGAIGSLIAGTGFGGAIIALILGVLLNWLLWSWVTMFVGTRLFKGEATFWEMARMVGYANAPQALGLFAFIPCVGAIIALIAFVLSLVIGFFAVREALDLPTEKAILTIIIGWVVIVIVNVILGAIGLTGAFALGRF